MTSAPSGNARCNAFASLHGARIHVSRSSAVVRITGIALWFTDFTGSLGSVVKKENRSIVSMPVLILRTEVQARPGMMG